MATVTTLVDDLDETTTVNVERLSFTIDGVEYTIDLSAPNRDKFYKALLPFVEKSTKHEPLVVRSTKRAGGSGRTKSELVAIRAWAKESGIEISDRGRIPRHVLASFDAI